MHHESINIYTFSAVKINFFLRQSFDEQCMSKDEETLEKGDLLDPDVSFGDF